MVAKYESAAAFREVAEKYFNQYPHPDNFAEEEEKLRAVQSIQSGLIPTLNGLALFLGFESIQSLYNYEKRDGFKSVLNWLRAKIASYWELNLNSKFANGAQKWLESVQPDNWGDKSKLKAPPPVALVVYVGNKNKSTPVVDAAFEEVQQIEAITEEKPKGRPKGSKDKKKRKRKSK